MLLCFNLQFSPTQMHSYTHLHQHQPLTRSLTDFFFYPQREHNTDTFECMNPCPSFGYVFAHLHAEKTERMFVYGISVCDASGPPSGRGVVAKVQSTRSETAGLTAVHPSSRPGHKTEKNDEKP